MLTAGRLVSRHHARIEICKTAPAAAGLFWSSMLIPLLFLSGSGATFIVLFRQHTLEIAVKIVSFSN
jgi:hypothetical protein